ncbi:hypothetical protein ACX93W_26855 [Paenibacillus sp. CAU 1782]
MRDTKLLDHILKELSDYAEHRKDGTLEEYRNGKGNLEFNMELLDRCYKELSSKEEERHAA